jgi:hypothetical protein
VSAGSPPFSPTSTHHSPSLKPRVLGSGAIIDDPPVLPSPLFLTRRRTNRRFPDCDNQGLWISGPAEIHAAPEPVSALEDEFAGLSCGFRGMGPPVTHTRWLKDGEQLKEVAGGPQRYRVLEHSGNSSLHFKNVQLSDSGSYVCEILTEGFPPLRSPPASLTVREKLKFSPPPVNRRLELNSTAKVS